MFLSELKIWNFRKYGSKDNNAPGLSLQLNPGFNLLVGENDCGKTALIDAIRIVLQTHSLDTVRLTEDDFNLPSNSNNESNRSKELKIECILRGFAINEAKHFLEWLGFETISKEEQFYLRVVLKANRESGRIYYDVRAGVDENGAIMDARARELLRVTYLKPLRDADFELAPRKNSRLSQILDSHGAFKDKESHYLLTIVKQANMGIECYFNGCDGEGKKIDDQAGKGLHQAINEYLSAFSSLRESETLSSGFAIANMKLRSILERLSLDLELDNPGLGSNNLLFIATELLLLKRQDYDGLKLVLIEEAEAHLHPQAQHRLIDYLEDEAAKSNIQLVLSSHSPNLASKVDLKNLIICKKDKVFPMAPEYTNLEIGDYAFLERFLDATKANLFFAQGVILVEGDAENILLPTIADLVDIPLAKYGISVVNVGSTAFLRYSLIFQRKNGSEYLPVPVACITDCDVKPDKVKECEIKAITESDFKEGREGERRRKEKLYDGQHVKTFISPIWTLEYDISASSFASCFYTAALCAKSLQNSDKFGVTGEKLANILEKVKNDFADWNSKGLSNADIAFEIYYKVILGGDISKAIVAQFFSKILKENDALVMKKRILEDEKFAYLVNAIKYAAGKDEKHA